MSWTSRGSRSGSAGQGAIISPERGQVHLSPTHTVTGEPGPTGQLEEFLLVFEINDAAEVVLRVVRIIAVAVRPRRPKRTGHAVHAGVRQRRLAIEDIGGADREASVPRRFPTHLHIVEGEAALTVQAIRRVGQVLMRLVA